MKDEESSAQKRKRSGTRYWKEINGSLYARLQYKAANGKYKVKYRPIADKRTARSAVEDMRRELDLHGEEFFNSDKTTFGDLADRYSEVELIKAVYQSGIRIKGRKSVAGVSSSIKPLRAYFGDRPIKSIKPSDILAYKHERLDTPIETLVKERVITIDPFSGKQTTTIQKTIRVRERKIATVNRELAWLRAIFNFAISNDLLIVNPFSKMKGIISASSEAGRDRILSHDEELRLLSACTGERAHIRPMVICALDTAMRRGEIFKMRWQDVNFTSNEILIPQTNSKTEQTRIVGITSRLRTELWSLWEVSPRIPDSLIFGITNNINHAWSTACRLAGIKDFRFHDCRHTATTRMIASGSPHTEVMKITGHSQMKTFLRYLNITAETANSVASRLSDYIAYRNPTADVTSEAVN